MADNRNTALYWAALYGRDEPCRMALNGNRKLKYIPEYPGFEMPESTGANRNNVAYRQDWKDAELGRTAVHEAAINGNWELIELFLKHGWSSDVKDIFRPISDQQDNELNRMPFPQFSNNTEKGTRPRDYAYQNEHYDVAMKLFIYDLATYMDIKHNEIDSYVLKEQDIGNILCYLLKEEETEIESYLDYTNNTAVSREALGACLYFDDNDDNNNNRNDTRCKSFQPINTSAEIKNDSKCRKCGRPASDHIKLNLNGLKQCFILISEKNRTNHYTESGRNLLMKYNQPDLIIQNKETSAREFLNAMQAIKRDPEMKNFIPLQIKKKKYRYGSTNYAELERDLEHLNQVTNIPPSVRRKLENCSQYQRRVQYSINNEQHVKTAAANASIEAGRHFIYLLQIFDNYKSTHLPKKRSATYMMMGSDGSKDNNNNNNNNNNNITNDDIPKTLKGLLMYLFMNRTDRPPVLVLHDVVLKILQGHFQMLFNNYFKR